MKFITAWFLFLICSLPLFAGEIFLFQTTDLHGILHDSDGKAGCPAVLSALAADADRTGREKSLLIDCGDLLQGSLESSRDHGKTMIRLLNAARYDVWVPGNHDFEFGAEALSDRIREFKGRVLAANLEFQNTISWSIFQKKGYRIAVIGMTNPHLDKWLFRPEEEGFRVSEIERPLKQAVAQILPKKPDAIILAIHSGLYPSKRLNDPGMFALARKFPELTLILGGHTHEKIICKQLGDSGVCYFQAGAHGGGYLKIKLDLPDRTRKKIAVSGEYIPVTPQKKLPADFRWDPVNDPGKYRFPVKPHSLETARVFASAIHQSFPDVKIVFHGELTKFKPQFPLLGLKHLFMVCPFENRVVLAYLTQEDVKKVIHEQETIPNNKTVQYPFYFPEGSSPFNGKKDQRVLTAFNSYSAAGAGGRYPVLKEILNRPESRAVLSDTRVFDLLKHYTKEK